MKAQGLLLAGLMLSSGLALATEQADPHHVIAYAKVGHGKKSPDKQPLNPPRRLSPIEFERLHQQSNQLSKELPAHTVKAKKKLPLKLSRSGSGSNLSALACTNADELLGLSGQALVDAVKGAELTSCLYGLYNTNWVGTEMFSDANLISIVDSINLLLAAYDGTTATGASELEKLVTFLRAMHWAETSSGNGRVFTANYKTQLQQALDSYFNGVHFVQFNGNSSRDFMVRYEMLILVNSSGSDRMRYMPRFSEALLGYANSVDRTDNWGLGYEESGMTQLLTHYFNALQYQQTEYEPVLASHPEIIQNLNTFVMQQGSWLIGHTREYQWSDAVSELGRFLKLGGAAAAIVRPSMQSILAQYSYDSVGGNGWINAQSMVAAYDSGNCALYGDACSFDLEGTILSGHHTCSDSIKIRFQEPISLTNLQQSCANLTAEEQLFHQTFATQTDTPVANDLNTDLEVVVFRSSTEYQNYAGTFFDINTDNGGMYLEGNPAEADNQARFIAFQATWLPDFTIWNLQHEYIHYLDGRFNKWGGFNDQPLNSVWWGEGLAEYLSQPENNANALAVASLNTYDLSELYQTTYENSNTARTYYWGYLAVRFMMERQRVEIDDELLPSMRAAKSLVAEGECQFGWGWQWKQDAIDSGWYWLYDDSEWASGNWVWTCGQAEPEGGPLPEYTPYQDVINSWGTRFDEEFDQWLVCLVSGEGQCDDSPANPADIDGNGAVDTHDVRQFTLMLQRGQELGLEYDFNGDLKVNMLDVRAMMSLCTNQRCRVNP
jgi:microbial collagenase